MGFRDWLGARCPRRTQDRKAAEAKLKELERLQRQKDEEEAAKNEQEDPRTS